MVYFKEEFQCSCVKYHPGKLFTTLDMNGSPSEKGIDWGGKERGTKEMTGAWLKEESPLSWRVGDHVK